MKRINPTNQSNSALRYLRKYNQKIVLTAALVFGFCLQTFATLVTHDWQETHRGYSVELIPGTGANGVPAEYVAAGTVYDQANMLPGWHFMHLDVNGNIISERSSWVQPGDLHEFRVVDIVCQSPTEFWITIQGRDMNPGAENDYVYVAGVDILGNDLSGNPSMVIKSDNQTHKNLYPTHSYFASNGSLYICGYAADGTEFPNEPDKYYSDKYGMFLKVDVATAIHSFYFWNTGYHNGKDYDMALKIAPYAYGQTFPLLVTGAMNTGDEWLSGVLVGKFNANGLAASLNGLLPTYYAISLNGEQRPWGIYGVDIRGDVHGGIGTPAATPDIVVLINSFDSYEQMNKSYGIGRIKDNLTCFPSSVLSYRFVRGDGISWAKQFLELHGNSNDQYSLNHTLIIGETTRFYDFNTNFSIPPPSLTPHNSNVNPFLTLTHFGNGWWDATSGFNVGMTNIAPHIVYLSSQSTWAMNMDYRNGSLGAGAIREDITRLYTFSSLERYYDDPAWGSNPPRQNPAMVLPIADVDETAPGYNPNLKTKFLKVDDLSPVYDETDCNKTVQDKIYPAFSDMFNTGVFSSIGYTDVNLYNGYTVFSLLNVFNNFPSYIDCSTDYYKPTSVATNNADNTVRIFPNPASTSVNINFGADIQGDYSFKLMDVTGKVVYQTSGVVGKVKVQLPQLSAGTYLATVSTNEVIHSEKLVIQ